MEMEIHKQGQKSRKQKKTILEARCCLPAQGMKMRAKIRAKRRIKQEGEWGGRWGEVGKLERAVWLIETESTDRKSLSCHKAERQSLFILLTSSLCFSTLSLDHPCITSLPLSHTHQKHGRPDRRMLWKKEVLSLMCPGRDVIRDCLSWTGDDGYWLFHYFSTETDVTLQIWRLMNGGWMTINFPVMQKLEQHGLSCEACKHIM